MTDQIDEIITDVMKAEGWDTYTNHPADRGGPTKWGITASSWALAIGREATEQDVRLIDESQARSFYRSRYVLAPNFHELPDLLQPLVVDCGVNHGVSVAAKWVQRAVAVKQDGVIGPQTLAAVGRTDTQAVYLKVCAYRFQLYGRLVTRDPDQAVFAHGWNNRGAKWLFRLADSLTRG